MILLTKLVLAHLTGDFLLQPSSWVQAKEEKKLKAYQLYLHSVLHGVLIMLLVWNWSFIRWAVLLAFIHLVIDAAKLLLQKPETKRVCFFMDQLAHGVSIYLIYCWYTGCAEINMFIFGEINWLLITMVVFLTMPSSFIIRIFIATWSPHTEENDGESLKDAGKYIGILERLFVFVCVLTNNWEAIGFLLTAKSVFRFGDLKESKDRKLTEYILIGTLLSFGVATLIGMTYIALMAKTT